MNKLLLPVLAVAATLLSAASAKADHYYRGGYCGPRVYRSYCEPVYRRPVVYDDCYVRPTYYAPAPVYYRSYECAPRPRVYVSRPRFSFFFGF